MKAAVYYAPGDIRVEERAEPVPNEDNIIVEIICCLICGTDLKVYKAGNPRVLPNQTLGHEISARITHVGGSWRKKYSVGQRVTFATTVACGECQYCRFGLGNMCPNARSIGCGCDGGFAQYMEAPAAAAQGGYIINADNGCSDEAIALSEPLSCAINAQSLIDVRRGDRVVIIGGGPLGAIHTELAKATGARVLLGDISANRLELLSRLKDVVLVDMSKGKLRDEVMNFTGGLGADKVIVCAPAAAAMEQAPALARKGGAISLFASLPSGASDITIDMRLIHYNELRVVGASDSRPEHVVKAVEILAGGEFDTNAILTHRVSLENFNDGLALMERRECLKTAVYPTGVASV